ncbi:MAG: lysylphosphatidylglycerol synthase transmembrane domain-containing protein [Verrucomicrobiota bacterium]
MSELVESTRPESSNSKRKTLDWKVFVKIFILVGILAFIFLFTDFSFAKLVGHITSADPWMLLGSFCCFGLVAVFVSYRWYYLLKIQEIYVSQFVAIQLSFIGIFFNSFLLGSTGGDVVRAVYILRYAPDKKARAFLSILMDRVIGFIILLIVGALLLLTQIEVISHDERTIWMAYSVYAFLACGVVGMIAAYFFPLSWIPQTLQSLWIKVPKREIIEQLYFGFKDHGKHWKHSFTAIILSLALITSNFTSAYLITTALGVDASYLTVALIFVITVIVMGLPISLGGIGTREAALLFLFVLFGLIPDKSESELPLAVSFLYFMVITSWSLIGGVFYLLYKKQVPVDLKERSSSNNSSEK